MKEIIKEFITKVTSKRVAVITAYLLYLGWVAQVIKNSLISNLLATELIAIPGVIVAGSIYAFTRVGGGDDIIPAREEYPSHLPGTTEVLPSGKIAWAEAPVKPMEEGATLLPSEDKP